MFIPDEQLLQEYALLAVKVGVNLQPGQPLSIRTSVNATHLAYLCAKCAYELGASTVFIDYLDGNMERLRYEKESIENMQEYPNWQIEKLKYGIEKNCALLSISGSDPDLYKGIDPDKIKAVSLARYKACGPYQYYTMNSIGQWSILAYPDPAWAKKVFPKLSQDEAMEALWQAILKAARVEKGKTIANWEIHCDNLAAHCTKLNAYQFKQLHYQASNGTDLYVGLANNHIWQGGAEKASGAYKCAFNANIPTEEVFTMPDRNKINGIVYTSKPLVLQGNVIDKLKFVFKDGKVVDYWASNNQQIIKNVLDTDEGSRSLGEVALISCDSPINTSGILFYDTLFDENASCHFALGACYPTTIQDGEKLSDEQLNAKGGNTSFNHVDFMIGTDDLNITGIDQNDQEVSVFKQGRFVF